MAEVSAKVKIKMKQGLMAVYKCSVKNLRDDDRKIVAIRSDILKSMKKEMDIDIISTIKPEGILWRDYQGGEKIVPKATDINVDGLTPAQIRSQKMLAGKARKKLERAEAAALLEQKQLKDAAALLPTDAGIVGEIVAGGERGETLETVGEESAVVTGEMTKEEIEEKSMEEFLASQKA